MTSPCLDSIQRAWREGRGSNRCKRNAFQLLASVDIWTPASFQSHEECGKPDRLIFHTADQDLVIDRASVIELHQTRDRGNTLSWIGLRVVELVWQLEDGEKLRLWMVAWSGETCVHAIRGTNRLYERLEEWLAVETGEGEKPGSMTHATSVDV